MPEGLFETLEGASYNPSSLYEDRAKLVVVHFWGTWCAPCESELPDLISFTKKFEALRDVKFLLVAVNDDPKMVKKHIKSFNSPSNVVWVTDNKNIYRDAYGTTRVPETYIFSPDKVTLRKYTGPQEWLKPLFLQVFNDFLGTIISRL